VEKIEAYLSMIDATESCLTLVSKDRVPKNTVPIASLPVSSSYRDPALFFPYGFETFIFGLFLPDDSGQMPAHGE